MGVGGHAPRQEGWPGPGRPAPCGGWGERASQGAAGSLWGREVRTGPTTHSVPALFSEKKRSTKSPSLLGSKVEGTTTYSPGGRRKRVLTSRRLMNCSDRALDELARKKSRFRCTAGWPTSWCRGRREGAAAAGSAHPEELPPDPEPRPQVLAKCLESWVRAQSPISCMALTSHVVSLPVKRGTDPACRMGCRWMQVR